MDHVQQAARYQFGNDEAAMRTPGSDELLLKPNPSPLPQYHGHQNHTEGCLGFTEFQEIVMGASKIFWEPLAAHPSWGL